jgi:hypothetical protein
VRSGGLAWSWRDATFGLVISAVAFVVIATDHVSSGLNLLLGALPAAVIGLGPTRAKRLGLVVVGVLFGLFVVVGSFIAQWALVAVLGMFALALGAALLAARRPLGMVALNLCVPLAGIGLSYAGLASSFGLGLLIIAGSVVAFGWSLCFPAYAQAESPRPPLMSAAGARDYGLRLGLAAASAAAIGFAFAVEHVGWIVGATLFVMRPTAQMQEARSIGRIVSVLAGAVAASWLLTMDLPPLAIAVVATASIVGAAATRRSRWYVTPAFSTFLVFWVLLYGEASTANVEHRIVERILETVVGVVVAYLFGIGIPKLLSLRRRTAEGAAPTARAETPTTEGDEGAPG